MLIGESAFALVLVDLVLAHQVAQTLNPSSGDHPGAVEGSVIAHCDRALDAECGGLVLAEMCYFGVAQQRLRRDAPYVQTSPSPILGLDDGHFEVKLGRPNCGDITTRTRAQNHHVVVHGCARYLRHFFTALS